jgi:polysaccharide deacetylase 2 family uncharacterized protein YibQ
LLVGFATLPNHKIVDAAAVPLHASAPHSTSARFAIVIDDIGFNVSFAEKFIALTPKITFAVIPQAPFASQLSHQAHRAGHQLILHLPMEPLQAEKGETHLFTTQMTAAEMRNFLNLNLVQTPYAIGFNNHQGSRFTADTNAVEKLLSIIADYQWLVLDSRTTAASKLAELAEQQGIPHLSRTVFLDNDRSVAAITQQLQQMWRHAQRGEPQVAIGHPYPETAQAVGHFLTQSPKILGQLVPLSQLLLN